MTIEPHRVWEGSWNFGDLRSHVFTVDGGDTGHEAQIGHKHEYDHMMVIRARKKPEGANAEPSVVAWLPEGRTKLRAQPGDAYYVRAGVQHSIEVPPGWAVEVSCWFARYNKDGTLREDPLAEARPTGKEAWNG